MFTIKNKNKKPRKLKESVRFIVEQPSKQTNKKILCLLEIVLPVSTTLSNFRPGVDERNLIATMTRKFTRLQVNYALLERRYKYVNNNTSYKLLLTCCTVAQGHVSYF